MSENPPPLEANLCPKLANSSVFVAFQAAFQAATGLRLELVGQLQETGCASGSVEPGSLCALLQRSVESAPPACREVNRRLLQSAALKESACCQCYAGMRLAAVPVSFDRSVVGYLTTGPVLGMPPDLDRFEAILGGLGRMDIGGLLHSMLMTLTFIPDRSTRHLMPEPLRCWNASPKN